MIHALGTTQQWDHMMDGWGMGLWWLLLLALLVLVVIVTWRLLEGSRSTRSPDSALDILKQRYARGEIDREEFEAKKRDLSRA